MLVPQSLCPLGVPEQDTMRATGNAGADNVEVAN